MNIITAGTRKITIPAFGPVVPARPRGGAAPVAAWYLPTGISSGDVSAAYQPIGADDLADSYINLNNPGTNDAAPGTAPTWNATDGWIFNGSTQYLLTGIVPTIGTSSAIARFSDIPDLAGSNNDYLFGLFESSGKQFGIVPRLGTVPVSVQYENGGTDNVGPWLAGGNLAITGGKGYRDGTPEATLTGGTATTIDIAIGGRRRTAGGGSIDSFLQVKIQAIAFYSIDLSDAQIDALVTAMAALP